MNMLQIKEKCQQKNPADRWQRSLFSKSFLYQEAQGDRRSLQQAILISNQVCIPT